MKGKKILEATLIVTIISTITRCMAFVFKIYLSRTLGAEIIGVYQITMSIFALIMALSASGIPQAMSRHIAREYALGNTKKVNGLITSALMLSVSIATLAMAILYLCPCITTHIFADNRCLDMFYIILPALISTSIYCVIRGYFSGVKNFVVYSNVELISEVISMLIVLSTILIGIFGSDMSHGIAIAFLISDYVGLAVLLVIFFAKGGRLAKPALLRPLITSALPMTSSRIVGSLMSSMMALALPMLLVRGGMDTSSATACYGRASGMVMPLIFVPSTLISALAVVIIPELAAIRGDGVRTAVNGAIKFTAIIAGIFLAIYIAIGDDIAEILYSDSMAGRYMLIASTIIPPMTFNQMAVSMLNTLGYEKKTFAYHLIGSAVLAVVILLTPKYIGIYGYFVGIATFHTLTGLLYMRVLRKVNALDDKVILSSLVLLTFAIILGILARMLPLHLHCQYLYVIIIGMMIMTAYMLFLTKCGYMDLSLLRRHRK